MYSHFDFITWVTPFGLMFLAAIFVSWFLARRTAVSNGVEGSPIDLLLMLSATLLPGLVRQERLAHSKTA